ncbi:molybdopterin-guanine dinucleotide biosynthesis protein B [Paenibacillus sp. LMG 31460]|uniref:Molybdopterin-guanine dinucleotide biosynthesis protein B n=1 Tax=Paenibacillus germinis TaxID=2654979 RepID=A0ABX1Z3H4_9BACL|nr:molybdopterin-guanine dinucleotide biosynthesis protein B [Paenibacillus germinis]NOU86796.1 molybdopterin-guanine dinucleotide biosynthesis protein B [Paenibacillus germinis]
MAYCIGFAGYSDSGKTTLVAKLIVEMKQRGYRIAVMKHDAHGHYKEAAGTDSTTFVESGAEAVVTLSPDGIHAFEKKRNPSLEEQISAYAHLDYVFIEGFKKEKHPKIAVFRTIEQSEIIHVLEPGPIAIATDMDNFNFDLTAFPSFDLNNIRGLADFIEQYVKSY